MRPHVAASSLLFSALAIGQAAVPVPPPSNVLAAPAFDGVWIAAERSRDGAYWCRGQRYKLRVDETGASYMPLFGPHVERNPLLTFSLPGTEVFELRKAENGFELDRGTVVERWHLTPGGAEQSFLLHERPSGDVLRVVPTADGELPFRTSDELGLHFGTVALGDVVYGHAFAVNDAGGKTLLSTRWTGQAIEIVLPIDATYPLLVDPIVSTVSIAIGASDDRDPEIAYDASADRWIVVMEERLSVVDSDIKFHRYNGAGALIGTGFAETGLANANVPAVANCASTDEFCIVWHHGVASIRARRVSTTGALSPELSVHSGQPINNPADGPDIGGSASDGYLITYTVDGLQFFPVVVAVRVPPISNSLTSVIVSQGTGCLQAKVGNQVGPSPQWPVVWSDRLSGCVGGTIHCRGVDPALALGTEITLPGTTLTNDAEAGVAFDGHNLIVMWQRTQLNGTNADVMAQILRQSASGLTYNQIGGQINLSALEPGVILANDQRDPVIATDGIRFCYVYDGTGDVRAATFAVVGNSIVFYEGSLVVGPAASNAAVAGMGEFGGPPTRYLVAYDSPFNTSPQNVQGTFVDGFQLGDRIVTATTGCRPVGGTQPQITHTGDSLLGNTVQLTMSGFVGLPVMIAGFPANTPLTLCGNIHFGSCRQGVTLPTLATVFGNQFTLTIPPSPGLVGFRVAVQGVDLTAGGCPASLFGIPFTVTDTKVITVR